MEKYSRKILKFEEKYGVSFKEFKKMWDEESIKDKHSYEIEEDYTTQSLAASK